MRYGGNTSCVVLRAGDAEPIVLDLGTGLRYFGQTQPLDGSFVGSALVSHLHWDHIQGLPFFVPILRAGATLDVYAPVQEDGLSVHDAFERFMTPPYFPVTISELPGRVRFHDCGEGTFSIGNAKVMCREIPHVGTTNGYRVELGGASVAYLSDHQQPYDGSFGISDGALELCADVDLLIHDAQYTTDEFPRKYNWGHCTIDYALWVAKESGAKRLALYHHDPMRDDESLDDVARCSRLAGERMGIEVFAAHEQQHLVI
jgi:ribonuclease BN (tRNA processing enzyme)